MLLIQHMQPAFKPDAIYHIYTHANGNESLFRTAENYNYFLQRYGYHIYPIAETYAYCLMPNHIHLMIGIRSKDEVLKYICNKKEPPLAFHEFETIGGFSKIISRQFSHLFNGYTQAFNKRYGRKGSLFMPNFKRKLVVNDLYFSDWSPISITILSIMALSETYLTGLILPYMLICTKNQLN